MRLTRKQALLWLSQFSAGVLALNATATCIDIQNAVSGASLVSYPGSTGYSSDIDHWALTNEAASACSVEPGTTADLSKIMEIIGLTRTPFAVKGGGHNTNPGFSSTTGIQISMVRFNNVTYNAKASTATIGAGLLWEEVYGALADYGVTVAGGRVAGVGVAGVTLGGGYSWLSSQHGLTIDTMVSYELVLPSGKITTVDSTSNPDLFFALKGGLNKFGVVTTFTFKAYHQGTVWGGYATYTATNYSTIMAASSRFQLTNTDPKASFITTFNFAQGSPIASILFFYDGPSPPPIFDEILSVPTLTADVGTRSFLSLVESSPGDQTKGYRGLMNCVSALKFTPAVVAQIVNQSEYWGTQAADKTLVFISIDVEPFTSNYFSFSQGGAYPHTSASPLDPILLYFAWVSSEFDDYYHSAIKEAAAAILQAAIDDGQDVGGAKQIVYPNYAVYDTPLANLYGSNVQRLETIRKLYDPTNVMGLTGGFKL
jgi:FAD/FMN-containing dehydrogenase